MYMAAGVFIIHSRYADRTVCGKFDRELGNDYLVADHALPRPAAARKKTAEDAAAAGTTVTVFKKEERRWLNLARKL
jgi:hypothetical protein